MLRHFSGGLANSNNINNTSNFSDNNANNNNGVRPVISFTKYFPKL